MQDKKHQLDNISKNKNKLREIPNIMEELNQSMEFEQQFFGPLPLEVLKNLTPEQSEKLLNNFINQDTKEHEMNMKVLNMIEENNKENRNIKKIIILTGIPSFLVLIGICLFSGNKDVLIELLKLTFAFLGGTGTGIFFSARRKNENDNIS
jgi:hypothetical protein